MVWALIASHVQMALLISKSSVSLAWMIGRLWSKTLDCGCRDQESHITCKSYLSGAAGHSRMGQSNQMLPTTNTRLVLLRTSRCQASRGVDPFLPKAGEPAFGRTHSDPHMGNQG